MPTVRVACQQLAPVIGDLDGNRTRALEAIGAAAAEGAQVVVLPELVSSGYVFRDAAEARTLAEPADGPTVAGWREAARARGIVVVGGFCEAGPDGRLFNSAAIVDPGGVRAVYRKAHLWDREPDVFTAGDRPPPVVDTAHGRLGVIVCYDLHFPEWVRQVAVAGAELLCVSANWPLGPRPAGERPLEALTAMVHAASNRMAIAVADRCGDERGVAWVGGTLIASAKGWLLAGGAGSRDRMMAIADVDLEASRDKAKGPRNDALADRRPDLYTV